jgi:hypothetical protein
LVSDPFFLYEFGYFVGAAHKAGSFSICICCAKRKGAFSSCGFSSGQNELIAAGTRIHFDFALVWKTAGVFRVDNSRLAAGIAFA